MVHAIVATGNVDQLIEVSNLHPAPAIAFDSETDKQPVLVEPITSSPVGIVEVYKKLVPHDERPTGTMGQ